MKRFKIKGKDNNFPSSIKYGILSILTGCPSDWMQHFCNFSVSFVVIFSTINFEEIKSNNSKTLIFNHLQRIKNTSFCQALLAVTIDKILSKKISHSSRRKKSSRGQSKFKCHSSEIIKLKKTLHSLLHQ